MTGQEFRGEILDEIVNRGRASFSSISLSTRKIITDVRENGDEALFRYTEKFDKVHLTRSTLRVPESEIKESYRKLEKEQVNYLRKAALNTTCFHERQKKDGWSLEMAEGVTIGQVTRPLSSIGVYTPGGKAVYPSSLLMCAIPARVAGVKKIVVCSPPGKKRYIDPALLVAADIAGVSEVYRVGGVQAVAAMAYGTETVPKVDKIVGPGNVFVTAAKMEVSKDVSIDIPAGPSEILIIADETANASFIASDLLAQAEHDSQAWAILLTTSKDLALAVEEEVYKQMESLSRTETVKSSIQRYGLIVIVNNIEESVDYANLIAPEHLQIQTINPRKVFGEIRSAGAVFLGEYSPVAFGDYSSGLNHVLPTGGYARTCSGLSTSDFAKTICFLQCTRQGYLNLKRMTIALARMEGFDGHAKSVSIRGGTDED